VKELLEALMREEREIYLENRSTKANGHYTRDLLDLVSPLKDLKVPRVREGNFLLQILPTELRGGNPLVLSQLGEAWGARRLKGFAETLMGSNHASRTQ